MQGHIWEKGFAEGDLKAELYADVHNTCLHMTMSVEDAGHCLYCLQAYIWDEGFAK